MGMRRLCYAAVSFIVGAWAFVKVNSISGPAFEPILAACGNAEISAEDFARETGYHSYEPKVGLGVFKILVCLITQFLLELRETYPAGLLTWGGVVVAALPLNGLMTITAGRRGAKGPVIYPTIIGLLYQLLGISVIFPLIYNPSYYFSGAKLGVPVTNLRITAAVIFTLPVTLLTYFVFASPTNGYTWEVSAGILGGPILAMLGLPLWLDKSPSMEVTSENVARSNSAIQRAYTFLSAVAFAIYSYLLVVAYQTYGLAFDELWRDIWSEAGPSVAFMTIDTGVLYLGELLFIAYHSEWKAFKAFLMTPLVGPGAACCIVLKELEGEGSNALLLGEKKTA
eukprot:CAMPEP_0185733684 /NCGR_PEP_ID=MMETSP1171-20130828/20293_1 /TAXON_ID=374046 /ORGANISM="Helicotheca tamensis, Strain CCMP826" /LENGTH=339 /DNA_ID=CAMNT_0028403469 /DNA_START=83 /DNA_END=1102 /DNA_ORIENTATION=-